MVKTQGNFCRCVLLMCWLLLTAGTAQALELTYNLPDPIPIGEEVQGYLEVEGHLDSMPEFSINEDERIALEIISREVQRHRRRDGEIVYRFPLRVRIDQAIEDLELPRLSMRTTDGRSAQAPRGTISALAPLEQARRGVQARLRPQSIVPGEHVTLTIRFIAPYHERWELDPDWQMPLPDWALSQGSVYLSSGAVRDTSGELWAMIVARRTLTAESSGEHAYSDSMPLRRQSRFGRRERRDAAIPVTFLTVRDLGGLQPPDDDRGLVGKVRIDSELSPEQIRVGEGAVLRVTVRGAQVEQLTSYPPPQVPGLRFYAVDGRSGRSDARGERTFRWQVIPQQAGTFTLSPVSLPWLDPEALRYERAHASSHVMQVGEGGRLLTVSPATLTPGSETLPDPLRQSPTWSPSVLQLWLLLIAGMVLAVVLRLGALLWQINWTGHRGRRLAQAWRRGDLAQVTTLAHHLLPQLPPGAQAAQAQAAIRALERHRYGGEALAQEQVRADLRVLEQLP